MYVSTNVKQSTKSEYFKIYTIYKKKNNINTI